MSLLPETVEAEILGMQRVDIHGQQYIDLAYKTAAGQLTERIGLDLTPGDLAAGETVLLHRQMNMLMKVTRPGEE